MNDAIYYPMMSFTIYTPTYDIYKYTYIRYVYSKLTTFNIQHTRIDASFFCRMMMYIETFLASIYINTNLSFSRFLNKILRSVALNHILST